MAIGYQTMLTLTGLNNSLGQNAVNVRNTLEKALQFFNEVVQPTGVAGLQAAPFNLSATDAQAFFTAANNMATVAQVYFGQIAQSPAFNFDNALAAVRSGS